MSDPTRDYEELRRLLASDPGGLTRDGLVVMDPDRPYHTGTAAPALVQRFIERPDGLAVPYESERERFAGTVLRYMTGTILFDAHLSDAVINQLVAGHPAPDVLAFCGSLLNNLARRDRGEAQRWAIETFLAPDARRRAEGLLHDDWIFLTPQVILSAAKLRLLLEDAPDPRSADVLGSDVMSAILGLADYLAADRTDEDTWGNAPTWFVIEMLQNQYFNATDDVGSVIARGRRVRELMHQLNATTARRLEELFEELTGAPFDIVTIVGLGLYTGTQETPSVAPEYFDSMRVDPKVRTAALAVLAGHIDELRSEAQTEFDRVPSKRGLDWGYNTFRKYPALRHPDGRIFVMHPGFLLDRCAIDGFELKVRTELRRRADAGDREAKSLDGAAGALFGKAYELYAGESLRAQLPELPGGAKRIWDDSDLQAIWPGRSLCDFVVDYGDAILAIDVVSKRLVEQTYAAGEIGALEADLAAIVDKKAKQLESTIGLLITRGHELGLPDPMSKGNVPVFPVIVSTGGFPWNPFIAAIVHQRVADAGLLTHARIRPLRVMTIRNLEEAEALVEEGGPSLARLLLDAHQRGDDGIALDQIIFSSGVRLRRPKRLDPLWIARFRELGILYGFDPDAIDDFPPNA